MMQLSKAYRNKKVFLTGHTGFKGSWMSVWLSELGAVVKGYALKPEKRSLYNEVKKHLKNHDSVIADIRNREKLAKEIAAFDPDYIFHLAAQPLVLESYKTPVETFGVNVMGTAHVLDAVKKLKKKCSVVIVTTDKVYRNPENGKPFKEDDALGGYDPYSASKAAAEIVTESFRLSFYNPLQYKQHLKGIASARAGNVIGGGDYAADRIVPDIYRALSKNQPVAVRNPNAVRPWQHVLEPLSGYLQLGARLSGDPVKFSTAYNFGPRNSDAISVEKLVEKAIRVWGSGIAKYQSLEDAKYEASFLKLNNSKAESELNWIPRWSASEAIKRTMEWYKMHEGKESAFELCKTQINEFSK